DLHAVDAGVPAGDHLALAELELERAAAVPRRVELVARRERDAHVVHRHLLPARRLGAVPDDEVVDPELERDVALGLLDLWTFERHGPRAYLPTLPHAFRRGYSAG